MPNEDELVSIGPQFGDGKGWGLIVVFTSSSVQGRAFVGAFFGAQLGSTFKESELAKEVKIFLVATARPGSGSVNSLQNVS